MLTSRNVAILTLAIAFLGLLMEPNVGTYLPNPLRPFACALTIIGALSYLWMRLWDDRRDGVVRLTIFFLCATMSTIGFAYVHYAEWFHLTGPHYSKRPEFRPSMLTFSYGIGAAVLFEGIYQFSKRVSKRGNK